MFGGLSSNHHQFAVSFKGLHALCGRAYASMIDRRVPAAYAWSIRISLCTLVSVTLVAGLSSCGVGLDEPNRDNQSMSPSDGAASSPRDGAAPPVFAVHASRISLASPQTIPGTNRIALSWSVHGKQLTFSVFVKRSERHAFESFA